MRFSLVDSIMFCLDESSGGRYSFPELLAHVGALRWPDACQEHFAWPLLPDRPPQYSEP